jgi:hypothetical protein
MSRNYLNFSKRSGLSDTDVIDIRLAYLTDKISVRNLAAHYFVPKSTIHDIIVYKTWNHVPEPVKLKQYKDYSVFPDGRILSNKTKKFLSTKMDRSGTLNVDLTVAGKRKSVSVASLVAKAFLGSKSTKLTYRDEDKTNVHFTNIVTR